MISMGKQKARLRLASAESIESSHKDDPDWIAWYRLSARI